MLRSPFSGHRRYSITHRAVQRLRELVPGVADEDDENLRDRLDTAIVKSEDAKKAVKTLDVMLGEPQVLVPLESFGETLFAIIKEDTVVTVLPRGHGEEILQRGQALEQRVKAGEVLMLNERERDEERREFPRRRWRRDAPPPVIERVIRGSANNGPVTVSSDDVIPPPDPEASQDSGPSLLQESLRSRDSKPVETITVTTRPKSKAKAKRVVVRIPERPAPPQSPVEQAIARSLDLGRRRAAVAALSEILEAHDEGTEVLPLWNQLLDDGLPPSLTIGDLIDAVRRVPAQ